MERNNNRAMLLAAYNYLQGTSLDWHQFLYKVTQAKPRKKPHFVPIRFASIPLDVKQHFLKLYNKPNPKRHKIRGWLSFCLDHTNGTRDIYAIGPHDTWYKAILAL